MATRFEATFGHAPDAIGSAPGRVNLIGEHTDYNGGMVLPTALHRGVDVALGRNDHNRVCIASTRFDAVAERAFEEPAAGHWSDYALGALVKARSLGWIGDGVDVLIDSDLPDGAGLSSSAALVTAVLRAAQKHARAALAPQELAQTARAVENDYIGVPCGMMDQMAVGLVRPGEALALDTVDARYEIIPLPQRWAFVVLHSGVQRALTDGRYAERVEECEQAARALGVEHLCRLSDESELAGLPMPLQARARHVVSEHQRTLAAVEALKAHDMAAFGDLMTASHASYARDFDASTPAIDALVKHSLACGAAGARLTGGGFGGCVVALMPDHREEAWVRKIQAGHRHARRV